MSQIRRLLLASMVMTAILAAFSGGTDAQAAGPASGGNCIGEPSPAGQADDGPLNVRCYPTFAQAVSAATGGRVSLAGTAQPGSLTRSQLGAIFAEPAGVTANTTYVLSIDFTDVQGGGRSWTWYQSAPCGNYQTAHMPTGWNDVVSSVHTYSGCAVTLFENANFGSPSWNVGVNSGASFGGTGFNDQASSEKWCTHLGCT